MKWLSTSRLRAGIHLMSALLCCVPLIACDRLGSGGTAFHSVDITGAPYAQRLDLPDTEGQMRSLADFKGKIAVVFFGYTHCPDVCPTTMAQLAQIKRELGPDGERLVAVFVTVDPQRDNAKLLKAYVQGFDPAFIALRGTPEQVSAAAQSFKVFYQQVPGRGASDYTVDHTAGAYVFDTQGRLRLFARYGQDTQKLRADIVTLLKGA